MISRRELISNAGLAGATLLGATAVNGTLTDSASAQAKTVPGGSESTKLFLPSDALAPSTADRLPLQWSKGRTKELQRRLQAAGYDGVLLTDRWNVIYFTGLFHTTTERMIHAFIPAVGDHPVWFYPALDRDLVRSWWQGPRRRRARSSKARRSTSGAGRSRA
jgi:Xaa-Pro dipeptidase